jgi:hypothetical protein
VDWLPDKSVIFKNFQGVTFSTLNELKEKVVKKKGLLITF